MFKSTKNISLQNILNCLEIYFHFQWKTEPVTGIPDNLLGRVAEESTHKQLKEQTDTYREGNMGPNEAHPQHLINKALFNLI